MRVFLTTTKFITAGCVAGVLWILVIWSSPSLAGLLVWAYMFGVLLGGLFWFSCSISAGGRFQHDRLLGLVDIPLATLVVYLGLLYALGENFMLEFPILRKAGALGVSLAVISGYVAFRLRGKLRPLLLLVSLALVTSVFYIWMLYGISNYLIFYAWSAPVWSMALGISIQLQLAGTKTARSDYKKSGTSVDSTLVEDAYETDHLRPQ
jgi:hypothetical protein